MFGLLAKRYYGNRWIGARRYHRSRTAKRVAVANSKTKKRIDSKRNRDVLHLLDVKNTYRSLNEVDDSRRYHPYKKFNYGLTIDSEPVRFGLTGFPRGIAGRNWHEQIGKRVGRIAFRNALRAIECLRRKQRKQVLHARGIAGGSTKKFKPPVRDWKSSIVC
jgi:hypothetical protein